MIKDWEVIDDPQVEVHTGGDSPHDMTLPGICEGYLLKRRKWPLKGWHKVRNSISVFMFIQEVDFMNKVRFYKDAV